MSRPVNSRCSPQWSLMRSARAKAPAARRTIRFMVQVDVATRTGASYFKAMIRAVGPHLLETERLDEERLLLADVADRQHCAKESMCPHVGADLLRGPGPPLVAGILDHLEQETHRVAEADVFGAEPLLNAAVLDLVMIEVLFPETGGTGRHGVAGR